MVLCAILLMVLVIGISYAFATLNLEGTKKQVINAGTLSLELDEDENNLTIENAMPMYDEVGMLQDAFTFRLINNSTVATNYKIKLVDITAEGVEKLDASLVRYGLTKNGEDFIGTLSELTGGVIDSGQTPLETIEYELRFWIVNTTEDESLISGKSLSYKIDVEVEQINKDYYEFVFHPNGGVGEDTTIICPYNEECDLSGVTFTRNNHTLLGWTTSADGELVYNADLTLEDIDINPGDSLDLYAVWEPYTYTVKYNANGGSGTTASSTHTYGTAKALTANGFTRTGYTFQGWSTSASATSATYTNGQSVTNLTTTNGATVDLYAVWKANTYTVVYNANGGSGTTASSTHTYGTAKALTANGFTRSNYTFLGWSTSASATSVMYTNSQSVTNLTATNGATVNLYAVWGLTYAYNQGNQYTTNTGGWSYARTYAGNGSTQLPNETTSFTSSYIQWSELGTDGNPYPQYYGAGYFQHKTLVNMKYAKKITFQYTVPTANYEIYEGVTYYPIVKFYVLNSSGATLASQTLSFSSAVTSLQNVSLNVSGKDLSFVRLRVECSTGATAGLIMTFRLYSVYATY